MDDSAAVAFRPKLLGGLPFTKRQSSLHQSYSHLSYFSESYFATAPRKFGESLARLRLYFRLIPTPFPFGASIIICEGFSLAAPAGTAEMIKSWVFLWVVLASKCRYDDEKQTTTSSREVGPHPISENSSSERLRSECTCSH